MSFVAPALLLWQICCDKGLFTSVVLYYSTLLFGIFIRVTVPKKCYIVGFWAAPYFSFSLTLPLQWSSSFMWGTLNQSYLLILTNLSISGQTVAATDHAQPMEMNLMTLVALPTYKDAVCVYARACMFVCVSV